MAKVHFLKTWPEYFQQVQNGNKKFELRKADRDFHVNDFLVLQEYHPEPKQYTGRNLVVQVTDVFDNIRNEDWGIDGLKPGYCILSFNCLTREVYDIKQY